MIFLDINNHHSRSTAWNNLFFYSEIRNVTDEDEGQRHTVTGTLCSKNSELTQK